MSEERTSIKWTAQSSVVVWYGK